MLRKYHGNESIIASVAYYGNTWESSTSPRHSTAANATTVTTTIEVRSTESGSLLVDTGSLRPMHGRPRECNVGHWRRCDHRHDAHRHHHG